MTLPAPLPRPVLLAALALLRKAFLGLPGDCSGLLASDLPDLARAARGSALETPLAGMAARSAPGEDAEQACAGLASAHVALFVAGREGIPAPPYQSCHEGDGLMLGPAAEAMQRRLAAEGLAVSGPASEPADHLPVQIEFLYYLVSAGRDAAAAAFAREVPGTWAGRFRQAVARAAGEDRDKGFFVQAADLLLATLDEAARLDRREA
ncbi:MAG: molecular chaperone TorD family protein [Thermodesulfobacteriota bacterium]